MGRQRAEKGIISPKPELLKLGECIYRFSSSDRGTFGYQAGEWWIREADFDEIVERAARKGVDLGQKAHWDLAVLPSWSKMNIVVKARVTGRIWAWVGLAKPQQELSPNGRAIRMYGHRTVHQLLSGRRDQTSFQRGPGPQAEAGFPESPELGGVGNRRGKGDSERADLAVFRRLAPGGGPAQNWPGTCSGSLGMTPDDLSTDTRTDPETGPPAIAAPARAVRLVAKPPPPPRVKPTPAPAVSSYSQTALLPAREPRSVLERKLAGMYDATDMLRVLDTEVALQRAKRLHGSGSRQALRVAAIALFFTLLIAALGAMSYLQGKLAERGFSRHGAGATASPTPGPAGPDAARTPR